MAKAKVEINKGNHVVACPEKIKEPGVADKLFGRTKLNAKDLTETPMEVISVVDSQVRAKHPRLSEPVVLHAKFLVRAAHPAAV
jgi:hypothetical protein